MYASAQNLALNVECLGTPISPLGKVNLFCMNFHVAAMRHGGFVRTDSSSGQTEEMLLLSSTSSRDVFAAAVVDRWSNTMYPGGT